MMRNRTLLAIVVVVALSLGATSLWAQADDGMPPLAEYGWILAELTPEQQNQLLIMAPQLMQTWYELTAEQQVQVKVWGKQAQECWGQLSAEQQAQMKTVGLQLMEWWLALSPEQQDWVKARAAQTYNWWSVQTPERQDQLKAAMGSAHAWYMGLAPEQQAEVQAAAQAAATELAPRMMQMNSGQWDEMLTTGSAAVAAGATLEMLYEGLVAMLDAWGL